MADVNSRTEDWRTLPWKDIQRNVFRLQRRIYQAARRNEAKRVHDLQRLLLRAWSARCLAVRRVTQDIRPGRLPHDAIEAVFNYTRLKPKYTLDADITKCFDRISHDAILGKLHTIRPIERLVRGWLKAGVLDQGKTIFPEAGTAQGGPHSPLLANIALHGLETVIHQAAPAKSPPGVIRFADDVVILHHDLDTLKRLAEVAREWLAGIGVELNPQKTYITHTLKPYNGQTGFDFPSTGSGQAWASTSGNTQWGNTAPVPTGANPATRPSSNPVARR